MLVRRFYNFFLSAKYRLPKFSVNSFLDTQTTVLYLTRCTGTVEHLPAVTRPPINFQGLGRPYYMQYLLDNSEQYCVVNIDQINLDDTQSLKSFELLRAVLENPDGIEVSDELLNCLEEDLKMCGLDDIYKFIALFTKHVNSKKLLQPLKCFNKMLLSRYFSDEDILKILWTIRDSQFKFDKHTNFWFFRKLIIKLYFKIHRLNSKQVVQLFLLMPKLHDSLTRNIKYSTQSKLLEVLPKLNANELGIVSYGLYNSKMPLIHMDLPSAILNKTLQEIENMNDLSFTKICKLFESSCIKESTKDLIDFQEKVIPHTTRFNEGNLIRLILSGAQNRCINPILWEVAADRFKKNMENYTPTQIERILFAMTLLSIQDKELVHLAVKHFKEKTGVKTSTLIEFLYQLVHHDFYPEDLLSLILSEDFMTKVKPETLTLELKHKYCFINCSVEIDKPTHNFQVLNLEQREKLFKVFKFKFYKTSLASTSKTYIKGTIPQLEDSYGKKTVCEANVLPHHDWGFVMKFNRNLEAQTFESPVETHYYAKEATKDGCVSLFIMLLPMYCFTYERLGPNLVTQKRIRHLRHLGYNPVVIPMNDWVQQKKDNNELNFLKNLIQKKLENLLQEKDT